VKNVSSCTIFLREWPIGEPLKITVVRGESKKDLSVIPSEAATLPEYPDA
jgi:hypothetical protein